MKFLSVIILFSIFLFIYSEEGNKTEDELYEEADKQFKKVLRDKQNEEFDKKYGKQETPADYDYEEVQRKRKENDRRLAEFIKKILKEAGLENAKTITRQQFKKLFSGVFEKLEKEEKKKQEVEYDENGNLKEKMKDSDWSYIRLIINLAFNTLVEKDKEVFDVEELPSYFVAEKIVESLKAMMKNVGLENLLDPYEVYLTEALGTMFLLNDTEKSKKNTIPENLDLDL